MSSVKRLSENAQEIVAEVGEVASVSRFVGGELSGVDLSGVNDVSGVVCGLILSMKSGEMDLLVVDYIAQPSCFGGDANVCEFVQFAGGVDGMIVECGMRRPLFGDCNVVRMVMLGSVEPILVVDDGWLEFGNESWTDVKSDEWFFGSDVAAWFSGIGTTPGVREVLGSGRSAW